MSLESTLSEDQKQKLATFVSEVDSAKILNQVQKMTFGSSTLVRFLAGAGFDTAKAMSQFKEFLSWREKYHIDKVTEVELPELPQIKKFLPNGFHQTDKSGRPVWIVQLGSLKLQELLEVVKLDRLEMYFLSEIELCLREKFDDCKEKFG